MDDIDAELARHGTGIPLPGEEPAETIDDVIHRLETSRAKMMALTRDPHADRIAELAADWTVPELETPRPTGRHAETRGHPHDRHRPGGAHPGRRTRAAHRHHVTIGQQVKAFDRHNIGVVVAIDDDAGTIDAKFTSHTGRTAIRALP